MHMQTMYVVEYLTYNFEQEGICIDQLSIEIQFTFILGNLKCFCRTFLYHQLQSAYSKYFFILWAIICAHRVKA